jgi:glutathione S-transferase
MKIIQSAFAPNPRRVRIFLAEKGVAVPYQDVDLIRQEHKEDGFSRVNPMKQVPVLVLQDGTALSETVAICRYFERLHPMPCLFGDTPLREAQVEMWNRRVEFGLLYPVAQVFRHLHPAMKDLEVPQIPEWADANRPRVVDMLGVLDTELATRPHVAGDDFSIADITALVAIDFMKPARITRPADFANLNRWYDEVSSRPSSTA